MKKLFPLLFPVLFFACQNSGNTSEEGTKEENTTSAPSEWKTLFDGSSFDAWRGYGKTEMPTGWVIEGDEMVIQKAPNPRPADFGGDIITKEKFGNFELQLEFMTTDTANSGILYLAVEGEHPIWFNAPEYQILDDQTYLSMGAVTPAQLTGSNYDIHAALADIVKPVGEWNEAKIVHENGRVEHWLNGKKTVEYQIGSSEWEALVEASKFQEIKSYGRAKEGHIGLQDHNYEVRFRNIKIRDL